MASIDRRTVVRCIAVSTATGHRVLPLLAASAIYVAYLITHPYPAFGAGLFLETAERIAANGYRLPEHIPGYTADGVPFAYPPLAFYVVALLIDSGGADPFAVARFLPGLLFIACLIPYHGIAAQLTSSPRQATLATLVFATAPAVLRWHISAGGIVRAMALLFALVCLYAGVRVFRSHDPRWVVIATGAFTLVVLSHPTYTVFVVVSYLALYVTLDRTPRGLVAGSVVGIGGVTMAAPWWLHVADVHGIETFLTAAGTHGGLGADGYEFLVQLTFPFERSVVEWLFYAIAYLGGLYALWRRRWFLPAWLLLVVFVVGKNRFLFVPGGVLAAVVVLEAIVPTVRGFVPAQRDSRRVSSAVVLTVVLVLTTAGTLYGAGVGNGIHGGAPTQPQFIDEDDREALEWAEQNTPPGATFVVLSDAAEWTPFVANRTILIGHWGVEWKDTDDYYAQVERFVSISTCRDQACLTRSLARANVQPDYVYVPTGQYTVRGRKVTQDPSMSESLAASGEYRVVFENDGVMIAETVGTGTQIPERAQQAWRIEGEGDMNGGDGGPPCQATATSVSN